MFDSLTLATFAGLLIGGESVLIPAVYASIIGILDPMTILIGATIATIISDSFWYGIGRLVPKEKILAHRFGIKQRHRIHKAEMLIQERGLTLLFVSKFIYGTRTAMQIVAGIEKLPFLRYLLVNTIGVITWTGLIFGIGFGLHTSLDQFHFSVWAMQIVFTVLFILVMLGLIWTNKKLSRKWFR